MNNLLKSVKMVMPDYIRVQSAKRDLVHAICSHPQLFLIDGNPQMCGFVVSIADVDKGVLEGMTETEFNELVGGRALLQYKSSLHDLAHNLVNYEPYFPPNYHDGIYSAPVSLNRKNKSSINQAA